MNTDKPKTAGTLFVVSAPSGAGKTSLVRALLEREPQLHLAVSFTTRPPRAGEIDGEHYHFIAPERFEQMVAEGAFVEYARVFDNAYGTAEATLRDKLAAGEDVLLEIDWQGARQVRARLADAVTIFIVPPSLEALEQRLRGRGQDSDAVIAQRMAAAQNELSHHHEYDYLIVNNAFDRALDDLQSLVRSSRLTLARQQVRLHDQLQAMLALK